MTSDEARWVMRAKAGDRAAFAALYQRYERRIYGFLYRMLRDADDAADLTQETFLKAYRALDKPGMDRDVSVWLHRIAANAGLDLLRRRRRRRWLPWDRREHDAPSSGREDDPEGVLLGGETRRAVLWVLGGMSPRHRQALLLREYAGLTHREIAAVIGLSRAAVKQRLFRGREEFRARYRRLEGCR